MTFHDPAVLLLVIPTLLLSGYAWRKKSHSQIIFPALSLFAEIPPTIRSRCAASLPGVRILAIMLVVIALARPQLQLREATATSRGIDLLLALDVSTSMLAVDRAVSANDRSRFKIARKVTRDFISRRSGDRIGMIAFAARPYPVAPLTLDHQWLNGVLDQLEIGGIEDGTALGDGLLAAVNRLRASPAKSRAIVLVTDGRNNAGSVQPLVAAQAAHTLGIRVHTVGIGGQGAAAFPVEDPLGGVTYRQVTADLDEATLRGIARTTGGQFYRATDGAALRKVFAEIDLLERRPIEEKVSISYRELFPPVLLAALLLLTVDTILRTTWLRRNP
ncbi:MAG: VWA domain-containing protein [Desulfuromonadaceae bacterium]|nr:VWA domain-containing protein [Desulfuromonadaceae bacterium]